MGWGKAGHFVLFVGEKWGLGNFVGRYLLIVCNLHPTYCM